jgi:small-conductance mechanosensitive channel
MSYFQTEELVPEELIAEAKDISGHVYEWFQTQVLTINTAIQLATVVGAIILAILLRPILLNIFSHLADQGEKLDTFKKWREPLTSYFAPILLSSLLFIFFNGAQVGLQAYEYPAVIARIAGSLAAAYVVIRLITGFIAEPFWSRTLAQLAWILAALNIFGWLQPVLEFLNKPLVPNINTGGEVHFSILVGLQGVLLAVVLLWLANRLSGLLRTRVEKLPSLTPSVQLLLSKAIQITLTTVAVIIILSSLNVPLGSLALLGGALSFGIGFGLQRIFANLISGVILLMDRSIKPGDVIEVDNTYGRVTSLGLRYTSVVTRDQKEHLIPNESFVTGKVVNWSFTDPVVRIKHKIGIAYHSDVHKAIELTVEAAKSIDRVLTDPPVVCQLREFADSAVILEVRFWIKDSHNGVGNVSSKVMLAIWDSFHKNNIDFPFPQRDVNLSSKQPIQVQITPANKK